MYFIGLDLGQRQDYSAVAVVERDERARSMHVRHLERLALGTPYTKVVERVGEVAWNPRLARDCRLVVDATGVGAPVVEMLRSARLPCSLTAVTITGGEHAHGRGEDWHVPKRDLLASVQVLLEDGRLKIQKTLSEAAALVRELTDIRIHQRVGGRVSMGAEGHGEHDDLALAVALACWRARRPEVLGAHRGCRGSDDLTSSYLPRSVA